MSGLVGAIAGCALGVFIFGGWRQQDDEVKQPRTPYHLREELRDGYYEGVMMKRIMQIYHPEGMPADENEEDEDAEDEAEEQTGAEDEFTWVGLERDQTKPEH